MNRIFKGIATGAMSLLVVVSLTSCSGVSNSLPEGANTENAAQFESLNDVASQVQNVIGASWNYEADPTFFVDVCDTSTTEESLLQAIMISSGFKKEGNVEAIEKAIEKVEELGYSILEGSQQMTGEPDGPDFTSSFTATKENEKIIVGTVGGTFSIWIKSDCYEGEMQDEFSPYAIKVNPDNPNVNTMEETVEG